MRYVIESIIIYLVTVDVIHSLLIGDICVNEEINRTGFCKLILKCPEAINDIRRHIFPKTCGFMGNEPIVCCTHEQNSTALGSIKPSTTTLSSMVLYDDIKPTTTSRPYVEDDSTEENISSKKCKEYAKFVYANWTSPVLLIGHFVTVDTCSIKSRASFAEPREFPHTALIGYEYLNTKHWKCGGTLLSERHVLTSAECTYSDTYGFARYVRLGVSDFSNTEDKSDLQDIAVLEIIKHPSYDENNLQNNVALLKLAIPAKLSPFVRPACLPTSQNLLFKQVLISGWGTVNSTESNDYILKQQVLNVKECCSSGVRNEKCNRKQFCGEQLDGYICVADKGGPAQIFHPDVYCSYTLVGVISSWDSCLSTQKPPVLMRVSRYIDWIESNIWS